MSVEDCFTSLDRLRQALRRHKLKYVSSTEEKNLLKASVETWFRTYRPMIVGSVGESETLTEIDQLFHAILQRSWKNTRRDIYTEAINKIAKLLRRNLLTEIKVAEWGEKKSTKVSTGDHGLTARLERLSPTLVDSYNQVIQDLASTRFSYRGTANELRELLREAVDLLAPDEKVEVSEGYIEGRKKAKSEDDKKRKPTRSEKIRFILSQRNNTGDIESAQKTTDLAIERLAALVSGPIYGRANAASHVQRDKSEVTHLLKYVEAVLSEILPP